MTIRELFGLLIIGIVFSQPSYAIFMSGDSVRIQYLVPNTSTVFATTDTTVGSSAEATFALGAALTDFTVDLLPGTGTIQLSGSSGSGTNQSFVPRDFNGVRIFDYTNTLDPFSSAIVSITQGTLTTLPVASVTENEILINMNPSDVNNDFTLPFLINVEVSSVPAPATLAMLGLGLAGFGHQRRKQIKAA